MYNNHLLIGAPVWLALLGSGAYAQSPDQGATLQLEEVVVTAQKRAENIQDVPLSIASVSSEALRDAGIQNASDLGKLVPSLQINPGLFASGVIIRIRGFGSAPNSATDSDVAAYVDSAFIPRPSAIMSSFLDVKNVEVLNGPQGTLFGRNAAVGAISINSNAPTTDKRSFDATLEGSNYGGRALTGGANFPVSKQFALRAAYKNSHTDGLFDNLLDGKTYGKSDQNVSRLSAKWDISDPAGRFARMPPLPMVMASMHRPLTPSSRVLAARRWSTTVTRRSPSTSSGQIPSIATGNRA